jgi:hypothetical protein
MKKLALSLAAVAALIPVAALAASYLVTVDLCQQWPNVRTKSGISLNALYKVEGLCDNGPQYHTLDLCKKYPQLVSRSGVIANAVARADGQCD